MNFNDITEFVRESNYATSTDWDALEDILARYVKVYNLDTNPDFQRGHVWTPDQQSAYIEYCLQGGPSGRDIYFNCPGFGGRAGDNHMVLVDGKQRIEAVRGFMYNRVPAFEHLYSQIEGRMNHHAVFTFRVNTLKTRAEVLRWYLVFNAGGTPHSNEEIERVKELLRIEESK